MSGRRVISLRGSSNLGPLATGHTTPATTHPSHRSIKKGKEREIEKEREKGREEKRQGTKRQA